MDLSVKFTIAKLNRMKKSKGNSFLILSLAFLFFAASSPDSAVNNAESKDASKMHLLASPNVTCNFLSLAGKTILDPQGGSNIGGAVYINNDQPASFPSAQTATPSDANEWTWGTMEAYIDLGSSQQISGVAIYKSWGSGTIQIRAATWNGTAFVEGAFIVDFDLSTANNQWFINSLNTAVSTRYLKIVRSISDSKFREIAICTGGGSSCNLSASYSNVQCNDNGTPSNSTDDSYTFDLDVSSSQGSGTYSTVINGSTQSGTYGQTLSAGPIPISAGNMSLNITDTNTPTCSASLIVNAPAPCSNPPSGNCNFFSLAGKTILDPQGGNNIGGALYINDDQPSAFPSAQAAAPANTNEWTWGTQEAYIDLGSSQQIGGIAIYKSWGSGTIQIRAATWNGSSFIEGAFIVDFDLSTANNQWFIQSLNTTVGTRYLKIVRSISDSKFREIAICTGGGSSCSLTASYTNLQCSDNNTPSNSTDDTYTFDLNVSSTQGSGSYSTSLNGNPLSGNYNQPLTVGPVLISAGNLSLNITDTNTPTCSTTIAVNTPTPCSAGVSCTDGIMNGNEQGIDCGGDCAACPTTPPSTSLSTTSDSGVIPASLSLQINHPVYDFDASDFTIENGTVGSLVKTGLNYDVQVYPVDYGKNMKIYLTANSLINAIGLENAASNEIVITTNPPNQDCFTVSQTENAAPAGTATQSSMQQGGVASRGNDDNTDGDFFASPSSVTFTNWETNPWWEVDLGKQATIHEIKVYNRIIENNTHLDDYYIFISPTPFGSQSMASILANNSITRLHVQELAATPSSYTFNAEQGQYVRIQLNKTAFLTFAEIQIIADQ